MPIIVKTAPEGWSLPSYVVVMIQIGNVGPLLYYFLQKHRPVKDSYLIYSVLSLGICGAVIFSTFYDVTVNVFDDNRSLPLLGAVLLFSFMACTSSVLVCFFVDVFEYMFKRCFFSLLVHALHGTLSRVVYGKVFYGCQFWWSHL